MHKETIYLNKQQMEFLKSAISSGLYEDVNEAVQKGLKLLEDEAQFVQNLKKRLSEGCKQAERGELYDGREVFREAFRLAEQKYSNTKELSQSEQVAK